MKEDLKMVVQQHCGRTASRITEISSVKGNGIVFLLKGPTCAGKTLTVEAIGEVLHRHILSVLCDLGTEPDKMETRLKACFDIATTFDAIVLIDEADIFLEERGQGGVVSNAIVSMFLKVLESSNGATFLTTNRKFSLDLAVHSRVRSIMYCINPSTGSKERDSGKP